LVEPDEVDVEELFESDFAELEVSDFESLVEVFAAGSELVVEDDDLPFERLSVL
jgi:hypothetical protein